MGFFGAEGVVNIQQQVVKLAAGAGFFVGFVLGAQVVDDVVGELDEGLALGLQMGLGGSGECAEGGVD